MKFEDPNLSAVSMLNPLNSTDRLLSVEEKSRFGTALINFATKALSAFLILLVFCIVAFAQVNAQHTEVETSTIPPEVATNEILPEISITGGGFVFEGEDAVFSITSSMIISEELALDLTVGAESSNYIVGQPSDYSRVVIPVGQTEVLHIVRTHDDEIEEANGLVELTLVAGTGFNINEANNVATIEVLDNDLTNPAVRVEAPKLSIQEGEIAEFKVISDGSLRGEFYLYYAIQASHDGLFRGLIGGHRYSYSELFSSNAGSLDPLIHSASIGEIEKSYRYQSIDDGEYHENSAITFTILAQNESSYNITTASATIAIGDNDAPIEIEELVETELPSEVELPIISIVSLHTESSPEGEPVQFRLVASNPLNDSIAISIDVAESGDMLDQSSIVSFINFPAGESTLNFGIETLDDENDEADSDLTVTLLADVSENTAYEVTADQNEQSASVIISDNDEPEIQVPTINIYTQTNSVIEGTEVTVRIVADILAPVAGWPVRYEKSQVGEFFASDFTGVDAIEIPAGKTITLAKFQTQDDQVDEVDGRFTIRLTERQAGVTVGSSNSLTIAVTDNDPSPVISITNAKSVTEGTDAYAEFKIIASKAFQTTQQIEFSLTGATWFIAGNQSSQLTFDAGSTSSLLRIPIADDDEIERDGELYVTILKPSGGWGYTVGFPSIARVSITDDDELPIIEITDVEADGRKRRSGGVEGQTFVFVFTATPAPRSDLNVKVDVDIEGDYLNVSPQQSESSGSFYIGTEASAIVTFAAGAETGTLQVATINDTTDEPNGSIAMTLLAGEGYLITKTTRNTRSIFLVDNDVAPIVKETESDSGEVVLSIKANKSRIDEGDNVAFEVRASKSSSEKLALNLAFSSNDEDFVRATKTTHAPYLKALRFAARSKAALVFYLPTTDDNIDKADIQITATLLPGKGYSVETGNNSATIVVVDNDAPRISISAASDEAITEGEAVRFVVRAMDRAVASELAVNVSITQNSDFITKQIPKGVNIAKDKQVTGLMVETVDDSEVQEDGVFTATISTGDGYQISSQKSATVFIKDNDSKEDRRVEPRVSIAGSVINALLTAAKVSSTTESIELPEISIVANTDEVAEGEIIGFTVKVSPVPGSTLAVKVSIDSPNGSIQEPSPISVTINADSSSAILELKTLDDDKLEAEEIITASVVEQSEYRVSSDAGSASVRVTDHLDQQRHEKIAEANREVIPEMVGRMNAQSLNMVAERIRSGFANDGQNTLQIGGTESLTGILAQSGYAVNEREVLKETLYNDSSFAFSLAPGIGTFGSATTWGTGNTLEFQQDSVGNSSIYGEILTSQLGLDVNLNQNLMVGFSGSNSDSEIEYKSTNSTLVYTAQSNGLFPYIGWQNSDGTDYLNVIGGIGAGTIGIRQPGSDLETLKSSLNLAEISGKMQLFSTEETSSDTSTELNLTGGLRAIRYATERDIGVVGGIDQQHSQSHLTFAGQHTKILLNGLVLRPTATVGIQLNNVNEQNKLGYAVESGLSLENPVGLTISGMGGLLYWLENFNSEPRFQGKLAFDSNHDNLGLTLDLLSNLGLKNTAESDSSWQRSLFAQSLESQLLKTTDYISTEIGYGLGINDGAGILTPYSKFHWTNSNQQQLKLGGRLSVGSGIGFDLSGSSVFHVNKDNEHQIKFSGELEW